MTSTDPPPTLVQELPPPPRFLRSRDDRVLGGVAGGLGRAFGVDAIIFRIALAALAFAGGVGLLVYGAALLFVPVDDGTGHPAPREGGRRLAVTGGGALLVLAALASLGDSGFWAGGWVVAAALVAGTGYAALRLVRGDGPQGSPLSRLGVIAAVGAAVIVGAFLAFWGSAWATAAGGGAAVAAVVLLLGAVLVAAALRGDKRARWLVVPALLIAFPAAVVSAADVSLDGGVGERTYRPTGADRLPSGYRLGVGELVVDLRDLDWRNGRRVALDLDVGVGHVAVLVPEAVCVGARSSIDAGRADVFGRDAEGLGVEHDVTRTPPASVPELTLDVHMAAGDFEVLHRMPAGPGRPGSAVRSVDTRLGPPDADAARRSADRACTGAAA